jgi:hypothetical protein
VTGGGCKPKSVRGRSKLPIFEPFLSRVPVDPLLPLLNLNSVRHRSRRERRRVVDQQTARFQPEPKRARQRERERERERERASKAPYQPNAGGQFGSRQHDAKTSAKPLALTLALTLALAPSYPALPAAHHCCFDLLNPTRPHSLLISAAVHTRASPSDPIPIPRWTSLPAFFKRSPLGRSLPWLRPFALRPSAFSPLAAVSTTPFDPDALPLKTLVARIGYPIYPLAAIPSRPSFSTNRSARLH